MARLSTTEATDKQNNKLTTNEAGKEHAKT